MMLRVRWLSWCVAAAAFGIASDHVRAQGAVTPMPVETLYADASAKEQAVRKALSDHDPSSTVLKAVQTVVADYENVVRRYPSSAFCDDSLWRAARLSAGAVPGVWGPGGRAPAPRLV